MRIAITGATGLVGKALIKELAAQGHQTLAVSRRPGADIQWNPNEKKLESAKLEGLDAIVHLAGEGIAEGRWNAARKQRIRDSRVLGTQFLCEAIAKLENRPATLVCASAIGYYGERGDEVCDEDSKVGSGFLADVCREWEAACDAARSVEARVVNLRIGVVLSPHGGALAKMLLPFKMGVGGIVGSGRQYWSWVSLEDVVGGIVHAMNCPSLRGPVNAVAPHAATNYDFTKALGRALGRPTIFPMPAFAARLLLGEMADALLLASTRVAPKRLLESHYQFRHGDLDHALKQLLTKN